MGAGFIAVGTHQKVQHDSFDAVYDRAYRLRYNRGGPMGRAAGGWLGGRGRQGQLMLMAGVLMMVAPPRPLWWPVMLPAAGQVLVDSISYSLAGAGLVLGTVVMNRGVMGGLAGLSLGLSLGPLVYAGAKAGKVIE